MNGDPYNFGTHPKYYGRYEPEDTVRFTHQREITGGSDLPPRLIVWAQSNLPDGEYIAQYRIERDAFGLARIDDINGERRIAVLSQEWP